MVQQPVTLSDLNGNLVAPINYLSDRGHVYKVRSVFNRLEYIYSGDFKKQYRVLTQDLAKSLIPLEGEFEEKVMGLFNLLKSQAPQISPLERPTYECVKSSDGSWQNRHRHARVTPSIALQKSYTSARVCSPETCSDCSTSNFFIVYCRNSKISEHGYECSMPRYSKQSARSRCEFGLPSQ